jgi:hypothetical protein
LQQAIIFAGGQAQTTCDGANGAKASSKLNKMPIISFTT